MALSENNQWLTLWSSGVVFQRAVSRRPLTFNVGFGAQRLAGSGRLQQLATAHSAQKCSPNATEGQRKTRSALMTI
jgi:hypothetical protein